MAIGARLPQWRLWRCFGCGKDLQSCVGVSRTHHASVTLRWSPVQPIQRHPSFLPWHGAFGVSSGVVKNFIAISIHNFNTFLLSTYLS